MRKTLIVLAVLVAPVATQADVTMNLSAGVLFENDGTTALADGSTVVLLADSAGDGFGDLTQPDAWSTDDDDMVLGHFEMDSATSGMAGVVVEPVMVSPLPSGLGQGDPLLLAWYDTPFSDGASGAGEGVHFGAMPTPSGWEIPSDGSTVELAWFTETLGGANPDSDGTAGQMTVPEPATMVLLGLGGGVALLRRRRSR